MPVFSIITVTYNAVDFLESTILSVISQSYPDIEYILIDGNSSDGTPELIKKYGPDISYWVSEPDHGLYDAMNKGLHKANGDYIWFLNAGDRLKHKHIVAELAKIAAYDNLPDILYGEIDLIDIHGNIIAHRRLKAPPVLSWKSFRMGMLVSHQAFIVKKKIAPEYDIQYRFSADFDWCIHCMKQAGPIINTHKCLVNYQYEGITTANRKASLKERYHIMCNYYGIFVTSILHIWFAFRFYWAKYTKKTV